MPVMKEGDIFENLLDGTEYVVKEVVNGTVVLRSRKGDRDIVTGVETLEIKIILSAKGKKCMVK